MCVNFIRSGIQLFSNNKIFLKFSKHLYALCYGVLEQVNSLLCVRLFVTCSLEWLIFTTEYKKTKEVHLSLSCINPFNRKSSSAIFPHVRLVILLCAFPWIFNDSHRIDTESRMYEHKKYRLTEQPVRLFTFQNPKYRHSNKT